MRLVDVFSGIGGFTSGARRAGVTVVAAVNHWDLAVKAHGANHPDVRHVHDDALRYDWRDLPAHDAGHLSPECTFFSRARGGRDGARRDVSRATAGCVRKYARTCRPRAVTVENVTEYGDSPEALATVRALGRMGYAHRRLVVNASDLGTPQSRVRLFDVFLLGADSVPAWDIPARVGRARTPVARVLDLARDSAGWNPVRSCVRRLMGLRPLAPATLRAIAEGWMRWGGSAFLVPYYGSWRRAGARPVVCSVSDPIGTLTTVDRYALARRLAGRWEMRMLTPREQAACFGFDASTVLLGTRREQVRLIGNAVCVPVSEWLCARVREAIG